MTSKSSKLTFFSFFTKALLSVAIGSASPRELWDRPAVKQDFGFKDRGFGLRRVKLFDAATNLLWKRNEL